MVILGEISTIYVQDSEKQQNNVSRISEENANNIELEQNIIKHSAPQGKYLRCNYFRVFIYPYS